MLLNHESSQLVLVDYQEKLLPAISDGHAVLKNATILASLAKKMRVPVYGTEHMPDKIGPFDPQLRSFCKATMRKSQFSACPEGLIDLLTQKGPAGNARSLPKHLQKPTEQNERASIVIAGVEAHVCLLQTALDLLDQEMEVWVVTDACGSRTERNRDAAFDRLAGNGAELVSTEMVVFEWLEGAENEHFKYALDLIK
ncbi:MAG TPA: isochorismatase family protein [Limnobacter sp.]|nr:isochorismatase family protein [Limnobacter sp.]